MPPKAKTNGVAPEFRTLLELHEEDDEALRRLVQRYQQLLWDNNDRSRCSKIFAIRQLIRYMDAQPELPPLLGGSPAIATKAKPKPKTKR